jgi:hypothetical protein
VSGGAGRLYCRAVSTHPNAAPRAERGDAILELIHILAKILGRREEKRAEADARLREAVMRPVRAGAEFELDQDEEERTMAVVDAHVREHVSSPETARVTDYAIYEPTELGVPVYAEVESTNVLGERVTNRFVVVLNRAMGVEGCLICQADPRVAREG